MKDTDTLERMFQMQRDLAKIMPYEKYPTDTNGKVAALCTALIHEVVELQMHTNWKWWKKPEEMDMDAAREELVDIWHFLIQVSIEMGMNPNDILREYVRKNKINHKRQEDGY